MLSIQEYLWQVEDYISLLEWSSMKSVRPAFGPRSLWIPKNWVLESEQYEEMSNWSQEMCFQDAAKCHQLLLDPHGYKHFRIRLSDKTCNTSYYFSLSDWMVPSRIVGLSESFGKDLQALYLLMRSFEWVVLWISSSYTESPTHRQLLWLCIAPFRWLLLWCIGFDLPQCANRLPLVRVANSPVPIDSDMNPKLGWEQRVRSKLVRYFGIAIGPLWNW